MQYLLRAFLYIAKLLAVATLIIAAVAFSFFAAMDVSNIYIMLKDGMQQRVVFLLRIEDAAIGDYFTESFQKTSPFMRTALYNDFIIRSFEHRISINKISVLPWQDTAVVHVSEWVTRIDGEKIDENTVQMNADASIKIPPPAWEHGKYEMHLVRVHGRWMIDSMKLLERLPEPVMPVMPSASPSPAVSPTAEPPPETSAPAPSATQ